MVTGHVMAAIAATRATNTQAATARSSDTRDASSAGLGARQPLLLREEQLPAAGVLLVEAKVLLREEQLPTAGALLVEAKALLHRL
jgi:hypothetical protein